MNKMIRTLGVSLVLVSIVACGQKSKETKITEVKNTQTAVADSAKIKEESKKAAIAEKNALPKPYHPEENAEAKIAELTAQAKKENKNIMIQAGGNWCIWCLRFNNYVQTTPELKKLVDDNYIYYHLNYSPDNKNEKIFAKYGNPGDKYGYPVFIVLDKDGKQIHTQDSSVLEEGKGYSLDKVKKFFEDWKPKAM
ncbi:thioredoxin family protein [Elizabethkingia ursingii]|uniref:thioredoxin family protein n=1 Tax=Elizabethkingia ursingii TaxID=1756150 RepID=UPI0020114494|nr:thioredoxin family protein [Elizabethkingia ursingii]MCL1668714.1 thioredoxin family protein [Elizabethkingia ursingii]